MPDPPLALPRPTLRHGGILPRHLWERRCFPAQRGFSAASSCRDPLWEAGLPCAEAPQATFFPVGFVAGAAQGSHHGCSCGAGLSAEVGRAPRGSYSQAGEVQPLLARHRETSIVPNVSITGCPRPQEWGEGDEDGAGSWQGTGVVTGTFRCSLTVASPSTMSGHKVAPAATWHSALPCFPRHPLVLWVHSWFFPWELISAPFHISYGSTIFHFQVDLIKGKKRLHQRVNIRKTEQTHSFLNLWEEKKQKFCPKCTFFFPSTQFGLELDRKFIAVLWAGTGEGEHPFPGALRHPGGASLSHLHGTPGGG